MEFTPDGDRHWTRPRYWRKLNSIGQVILSCSDELPDLVALVEVENDSVLCDLTRRSLLRNAGYEYLMTTSPDVRGIDVALLYHPARFRPLCYESLSVTPLRDMRPTRDILYVKGHTVSCDTLHVFVVHAPSRYGGEQHSRAFRMQVASRLVSAVDSVLARQPGAKVLVAGDFNATLRDHSLHFVQSHGLESVIRHARGRNGTPSNYRYQGRWQQIDHVFCSPSLSRLVDSSYVNDSPFLLADDDQYGGKRPFRCFNGFRYLHGFSDHLPLVVCFNFAQ